MRWLKRLWARIVGWWRPAPPQPEIAQEPAASPASPDLDVTQQLLDQQLRMRREAFIIRRMKR
jgi:hypothetical protein